LNLGIFLAIFATMFKDILVLIFLCHCLAEKRQFERPVHLNDRTEIHNQLAHGSDIDSSGAGGLSFKVTASSATDPLTSKVFEVSAVNNTPPASNWLLLETVDGPCFSGLPLWFPLDSNFHASSTKVAWWSEYADRNKEVLDRGSFSVALSAWHGRNGTRLATASKNAVVFFDKSYTALLWNLTAVQRGTPGAVRLVLTPANNMSKALAPKTASVWWFRYKYTTTSAASGIAEFAEDKSIDMRLEPPTFDLSLSLGGRIYFVGIFGSFSGGISGGHPGECHT
jgi:hypothetical protein